MRNHAEMLTEAQQQVLRENARELSKFGLRAFAHLRTKPLPASEEIEALRHVRG
jgi:hypothetical protein